MSWARRWLRSCAWAAGSRTTTVRTPDSIPEFRQLSRLLSGLQERGTRTRMVSVATIAGPLEQAVRVTARSSGKQVRWEISGADLALYTAKAAGRNSVRPVSVTRQPESA
jgi:hypothetical protein